MYRPTYCYMHKHYFHWTSDILYFGQMCVDKFYAKVHLTYFIDCAFIISMYVYIIEYRILYKHTHTYIHNKNNNSDSNKKGLIYNWKFIKGSQFGQVQNYQPYKSQLITVIRLKIKTIFPRLLVCVCVCTAHAMAFN